MKYGFGFLFLLACSCGDKSKQRNAGNVPVAASADAAQSIPKSNRVSALAEEGSKQVVFDFTGYNTTAGDPDTSLAIFMYNEYKSYNYDSQREEYIRIDLENDKIMRLFRDLFYDRADYQDAIKAVQNNRNQFLKEARELVEKEYYTSHAVCGSMETEYLISRNDAWMKELLQKMLNDTEVKEDEKKEVRKALAELSKTVKQ